MIIPKILHIAWKSKDLLSSTLPIVLNGVSNFHKLNPDWTVNISTDEEVDRYLKDNLSAFDYSILQGEHIVAKIDVWRLIKMYNEGGVYQDVDRLYNIPMTKILPNERIECILPTCGDLDFSQDIMISIPNNPIFQKTARLSLARRRSGVRNIYFLGPVTYMHVISKELCGTQLDQNPGEEVFDKLRNRLELLSMTETYREQPPFDTVTFRFDPVRWQHGSFFSSKIDQQYLEEQKKALYSEFGIKHWSGAF